MLATIETLRSSETPRFVFDSEQATKYSAVDSPEFTLTGTLWEALRQIGTYIHSIPRLKDNVIYFEELGGDEKVDNQLTDYISNTEKFDIEQFASAIDSTVQNMVNLDDYTEGSIIEPYREGYKTLRTEMGTVQITTDNMFIQTKEPIEKIIKVEVGYLSDGSVVGDITPYVYESAEYDALSSYEDNYPYAKAYAIKYSVGSKSITGLNFKLPSAIGTSAFSKFSIVNIISRVANKSVSSSDILKLQFRVTYIPITTTRIKQIKPYYEDLTFDSTLAYNQSAQKISSRAYGEAMKGAIARLGNPEITKVFILNDLSLIPKAGQLYDNDYYISVVKCEYYDDFVKCSLGLSKDFNKLNEYVGINSEERFYEISETQSSDRYVLYEEYCSISGYTPETTEDVSYYNTLLTDDGVDNFKKLFEQEGIEIAFATTHSNSYGDDVILPVTSYGIGNSSIFTFRYDDNYSAGEKSLFDSGSYLQNQVQYTDDYGEADYLQLTFMNTTSTNTDTYSEAWQEGNSLPLYDYEKVKFHGDVLADSGADSIVLKKDNREKIIFTYQIHYVCNKNIIIGSLPYRNGLVGKNSDYGADFINCFYALDYEIPKYAKTVDLSNATPLGTSQLSMTDIYKRISAVRNKKVGFVVSKKANVTLNCKSIAVALPDGELLVGINREFDEEIDIPMALLSFKFTRKIN